MGKITGAANTTFRDASFIYSKIKRQLKSYVDAGLVDENEFPIYTKEVLDKLGNGALMETEGIVEIINGKGELPADMVRLHSAYRCHQVNSSKTKTTKHLQNEFFLETDITCEVRETDHCFPCKDKVIKSVHIKEYVNSCINQCEYDNFVLLRLSPNVKSRCAENCLNMFATTNQEISIEDKTVLTNFDNGFIFVKYYSMPVNEDGIPMVPDNVNIMNAVEWHIKYQLLQNLWFNSDAADLSNKWQVAAQEADKWMAEARFEVRLPSFATMMNGARNKRVFNAVNYFSSIDNKR